MAAAAAASLRPPCCSNCSPIRPRHNPTRNCWSAPRPATMPRCGSWTTAPASSPPPTSSCRWSTTRFEFGRIAATNAISDVYAMGGTPIMALAILGMPVDKIAGRDGARRSSRAARAVCAAAGIPVAGGHSIDCPEPIYGLAVIGTCKERGRPPQRRRTGWRRAHPDQGAGRRHLLGGDQEGRAVGRRLCRHDRLDDAAQSRSAPSLPRTRRSMR